MAYLIDDLIIQELCLVDGVVCRAKTGKPQVFAVTKDGYKFCSIQRKVIYLHRAVWVLHNGKLLVEMEIDHVDGDRDCNEIGNLRLCTRSENCQNTFIRKDNSSGFKGVFWDNYSQSWRVSIWKDKTKRDLGRFRSLSEAALVAALARKKIHGDFANHGFRSRETA